MDRSPLNEFHDVRPIGEGGFGTVFVGRRRITANLSVVRALKWIPPSSRGRKAFEEAKTLQFLLHPNIVTYYSSWKETESWLSTHPFMEKPLKNWKERMADDNHEFDDSRPDLPTAETTFDDSSSSSAVHPEKDFPQADTSAVHFFLEMELCEGGSLHDKIRMRNELYRKDGKILDIPGTPHVPELFISITRAVEFLHRDHKIHRDLKPENIFLTRHGVVKVGDFGLVTADGEVSTGMKTWKPCAENTRGIGTPFYLPPEQIRKYVYNETVDVFQMGLIFFEVLYPSIAAWPQRRDIIYNITRQQRFPEDFMDFAKRYGPLLQRMLLPSADERPTAAGVLKWLQDQPIIDGFPSIVVDPKMVPLGKVETELKEYLLPSVHPGEQGFDVPSAVVTGAYSESQIRAVLQAIRNTPSDLSTTALVDHLKNYQDLGTPIERSEIWLNGSCQLSFLLDMERVFRSLPLEKMENKGRIMVQEHIESYPHSKCRQILNCFENMPVVFVIHSAKLSTFNTGAFDRFVGEIGYYKLRSPRERAVLILMDEPDMKEHNGCEATCVGFNESGGPIVTPAFRKFHFGAASEATTDNEVTIKATSNNSVVGNLLRHFPSHGMSQEALKVCCAQLDIHESEIAVFAADHPDDFVICNGMVNISNGLKSPRLSSEELTRLWGGIVEEGKTNRFPNKLEFELLFISMRLFLDGIRIDENVLETNFETMVSQLLERELHVELWLLSDVVQKRFSGIRTIGFFAFAVCHTATAFCQFSDRKVVAETIIKSLLNELNQEPLVLSFHLLICLSFALNLTTSNEHLPIHESLAEHLRNLGSQGRLLSDAHRIQVQRHLFLVYMKQGKFVDADKIFLEVKEGDGPPLLYLSQQLILLLHVMGKDDEALHLAEEMMETLNDIDRLKWFLQMVGGILSTLGSQRSADNLYKEVWSHRVQLLGEIHEETISAFVDIAANQLTLEYANRNRSIEQLKEVLSFQTSCLKEDAIRLWRTKSVLAQALANGGKPTAQEAINLLLPIRNGGCFEGLLMAQDPIAMQILFTLGRAYLHVNNFTEAEQFLGLFSGLQGSHVGKNHPLTILARRGLAEVWIHQGGGKLQRAIGVLLNLLVQESELDLETIATRKLLAIAYAAKAEASTNPSEYSKFLEMARSTYSQLYHDCANGTNVSLEETSVILSKLCVLLYKMGDREEYTRYRNILFSIGRTIKEFREDGVLTHVSKASFLPREPSEPAEKEADEVFALLAAGLEVEVHPPADETSETRIKRKSHVLHLPYFK